MKTLIRFVELIQWLVIFVVLALVLDNKWPGRR